MRSVLLTLVVLAVAMFAMCEATGFWKSMETDKQWSPAQKSKVEKILQLLDWPQAERSDVLEQFSKLSPKDIDEILVNFYHGLGSIKPSSLIESDNNSDDVVVPRS